jgi:predicted transcriptional regulator
MSSLRSFIRTLAIATACAFIAAPLAASAEEKPKSPRVEKVSKRHHDKGEFPMEPTKFTEIVDRKIDLARAQMELIMTANALPDGVKAQIRKDFDAAAVKMRAAAKDAGKDGKVSKEEAKDVRKQARGFVNQLREKYGKDKDKSADKGRGKRHHKDA